MIGTQKQVETNDFSVKMSVYNFLILLLTNNFTSAKLKGGRNN